MHSSGKGESPQWRVSLRTNRRTSLVLAASRLLVLHLFFLHCPGLGQQPSTTEDQVKAAYLLNFAKLAEWPQTALPDGPSPLVIGVNGGDENFLGVLKAIVAGRFAGPHRLEVKPVSSREEMESCNIVFFRAPERKQTQALLEGIGQAGVLFVGEDQFFLRQGGMINLVHDRGSIHFEVNADALDHSGIHFSAKILALAKAGSGASRTSLSDLPAEGMQQEGTRRLEHTIVPEYPEIADRMKLVGIVQVEAVVRPDGTVREVRVIGGHPLLAQALVRAVKQWKYQPAAKETVETIKFSFDHTSN